MSHAPFLVLIVEDDPVFRRVISFTVARCGVTVEAVGDGEAAYERLSRGGIDFLVTDHQMPLCSGIELLTRVAANPQIPTPPTILCTAKGLELDSQLLQTQFDLVAIMHKPFSPRKLCELIVGHVGEAALRPPASTAKPAPIAGAISPAGVTHNA